MPNELMQHLMRFRADDFDGVIPMRGRKHSSAGAERERDGGTRGSRQLHTGPARRAHKHRLGDARTGCRALMPSRVHPHRAPPQHGSDAREGNGLRGAIVLGPRHCCQLLSSPNRVKYLVQVFHLFFSLLSFHFSTKKILFNTRIYRYPGTPIPFPVLYWYFCVRDSDTRVQYLGLCGISGYSNWVHWGFNTGLILGINHRPRDDSKN